MAQPDLDLKSPKDHDGADSGCVGCKMNNSKGNVCPKRIDNCLSFTDTASVKHLVSWIQVVNHVCNSNGK